MNDDRNKRQRITHACDLCRKKKIKCDGGRPTCSNCSNSRTSCAYSETVRKPRLPRKKKSMAKELDSRLEKIESILSVLVEESNHKRRLPLGHRRSSKSYRAASAAAESESEKMSDKSGSDSNVSDRSSSEYSSDGDSSHHDQASDPPDIFSPALMEIRRSDQAITDMSDRYTISTMKTSKFLAGNSVLSLFSPKGMNWIQDKSGISLDPLLETLQSVHDFYQERLRPLIGRIGLNSISLDKELIYWCFDLYKKGPPIWNMILPISKMETIIKAEFDEEYKKNLSQDEMNGYIELLALYTLVALIFSILVRVETMREKLGISVEKARNIEFDYLAAAFNYLKKITVCLVSNILTLECCCLLFMATNCMDCPQPMFNVIHEAQRLCNDLGLAKRELLKSFSPVDATHRNFLFWTTFVFECDLSMKCGISFSQLASYEYDVPLPDPAYMEVPQETMDLFNYLIAFFQNSGKIYRIMHDHDKYDREHVVQLVDTLETDLETWRLSIPESYRPEFDGRAAVTDITNSYGFMNELEAFQEGVFEKVTILYLNCSYFQALIDINRFINTYKAKASVGRADKKSSMMNSRTSSPKNAPSPRLWDSKKISNARELSLKASRSMLEQILAIQGRDRYFLFGPMFFTSNAVITLFIGVLTHPTHPLVSRDINLMHQLSSAYQKSPGQLNMVSLVRFWSVLAKFAERAIANSANEVEKRRAKKRKLHGHSDSQLSSDISPDSAFLSGTTPNTEQNGMRSTADMNTNLNNALLTDDSFLESDSMDKFFSATEALSSNILADPGSANNLYQFSNYLYSMDPDSNWA